LNSAALQPFSGKMYQYYSSKVRFLAPPNQTLTYNIR
jgi:hypothetical protein